MAIEKDLTIPKEILKLFPNSVRVIDKKHLIGIRPIDPAKIKNLPEVLPQIFKDEKIKKNFNISIGYNGKTAKADLSKIGLEFLPERLLPDIWIHGIPVPWIYLKKAGIDNKKFTIVIEPK